MIALGRLKGVSVTDKVKQRYKESPYRTVIETKAIDKLIDKDYKPYEKVLDKAIRGKGDSRHDLKKWRKLLQKLKAGTGYSKQTRHEIDNVIPAIVQRLYEGTTTEQDKQFLKRELKPFLEYLKKEEKSKLLLKRMQE